jgi:hypothetical protein
MPHRLFIVLQNELPARLLCVFPYGLQMLNIFLGEMGEE